MDHVGRQLVRSPEPELEHTTRRCRRCSRRAVTAVSLCFSHYSLTYLLGSVVVQ
jgi:hypothetical protein